jgi:hypothetical protein
MQNGFAEGVPTVTIELGGKSYPIGFTMGSMKRAQDLGVLKVNVEDATAMMLALPEYVWACLNEEGRKELSVDAIRELISPTNLEAITEKISELFKASLPEPGPEGNASPAAALETMIETTAGMRSSTSSSSTQSAATT